MQCRILAAAAALALFAFAHPARAAYSAATSNGWFTTAGRTASGATHADLWLFNPDLTNLASVTLVFHPAVLSGSPAGAPVSSAVIILDTRETKYFADVTSAVLPAGDGVFGAIEWQSNLPLLGLLRNVSSAGGGTTGPIVSATPQSEAMTPKASPTDAVNVLQLVGLNSGDANFSSQLDVANASDVVVPVEVQVVDPVTNVVIGSTQSFSVAPRSLLRAGNILQAVGAAVEDGLRITVSIAAGTSVPAGGIVAMATVTDSRSGDSFASLGQRQSAAVGSGGPCTPDAQSLCLSNGRFKVQAAWQTSTSSGTGTAIPGSSDTGQFWFFSASNVEMVVKVLNGCSINNNYWVFAGGLTNVHVTMTVTDMSNAAVKTYVNSLNTPFAPIQDTVAFATCP
jgi:hypothetical protein